MQTQGDTAVPPAPGGPRSTGLRGLSDLVLRFMDAPAPVAGTAVAATVAASWIVGIGVGGADHVAPHWFYLAVLLGALRFGPLGGGLVGLACAAVAGPLLPGDTGLRTAQETSDWVSRGIAFVLFGQVFAAIFARLRSAHARELALADANVELYRRLAFTDSVTGAASRLLFTNRAAHALSRRGLVEGSVAVLLCDLDDFKKINDSLGHPAGDVILRQVAERIGSSVRPGDTVARLGGDEFAILLEDLGDRVEAVGVAERLLAFLGQPYEVGAATVSMGVSIGIAQRVDGATPETLLRDADAAMYQAKRHGKNRCEVFSEEVLVAAHDRLRLEQDLREAVDGGRLGIAYQAQIDLRTGRVVGAEALARWSHAERGEVPPAVFIPVAEECGLIGAIGRWVLARGLADCAGWRREGLGALRLAVNLSALELEDPGVARAVSEALQSAGIDPHLLELEVTETVAAHAAPHALDRLGELKQLGVRIAVDDFGTGYSTLTNLQRFPVDTLKIDRSFVSAAVRSDTDDVIVAATIAMGHSLGLTVIAEGVETPAQLAALRRHGCDEAQGFLISRPVAPGAFSRLLADLASRRAALAGDEVFDADRRDPAERRRLDTAILPFLIELERLTGLESTYLTAVHLARGEQEILVARNVGDLEVPAGMVVDWSDTLCRRALAEGRSATDCVPETWPDSEAARQLGLQTYVSVPIERREGQLIGTLCAASTRRVPVGETVVDAMAAFARLIAQRVGDMEEFRRDAEPAAVAGAPG